MEDALRFQAFAAPHLHAAYNLARWLMRNDADAEDVVQDALVRAYRARDDFRGGSARAWLLSIVRHVAWTALEARRRGAVTIPLEQLDEGELVRASAFDLDPQVICDRADVARHVNAAVGALPVPFREVFILREFEEYSYREIAAIAGVPEGTVMSRLARARALLRRSLAAAVATGWLLGIGTVFLLTHDSATDRLVNAHTASLGDEPAIMVASNDRHTVKPWFAGRIDFAPDVVDLREKGFVLAGGRTQEIGSRTHAVLVYGRRAHVIQVFADVPRIDWFLHDGLVGPQMVRGFNRFEWFRGGVRYVAISDLNAAELGEFAAAFSSAAATPR